MFGQLITKPVQQKATYTISELLAEFDNDKTALAKSLNVNRSTVRKHAPLGESSHVVLRNGDKYKLYVITRLGGD